jgi:membrane-bound lytic murein transglycosylase B
MDEGMKQVLETEGTEAEKLQALFHHITDTIIRYGENQMELLKAINDQEELMKERIKVSTIRHAKSILDQCNAMLQHSKQKGV